jgi:hypothetical protein
VASGVRADHGILVTLVALLSLPLAVSLAARERLELRYAALDLPGPPARVLPADIDGDGRQDLLVVVAFTEIEEIGEDFIENMVQISRVIPTLFNRRELRVYLATEAGSYRQAGAPMELPPSVLHLESGPPSVGVVALTDAGLSRLRFDPSAEPALRLDPVVRDTPILARTGTFFASLELLHDLDGDGIEDLLHPSAEGPAVYLATASGLTAEPAYRVELPAESDTSGRRASRRYPFPTVREIDGDGLPDLVFGSAFRSGSPSRVHVFLGSGGGRFEKMRETALDCHDQLTDLRMAVDDPQLNPWPENLTALRDIDGDGRAEAVISEERSRGDSWRKELKDAKKPVQDYSFHELDEALSIDPAPYFRMKVVGHAMEGGLDDEEDASGSPFSFMEFADLDADGREDLITVTLEFSIFQVMKILATKKIGIGFNFHVHCQNEDGTFLEVPDLDLSEKLKLNLNNLEIGRFAQFAGDFDGDGRQDFVHLGRGRMVTIHRGQAGCRYPKNPDLTIELDQEPDSLDLVRIEDLDGDGRADIRITRPVVSDDPDVTAPVRLDLYLSGEAP